MLFDPLLGCPRTPKGHLLSSMNKRTLLHSLFESYQKDLQRFVAHKFGSHHDAEDIVQEAFHNVLRRVDMAQMDNPKAYLYQTASNLALNRIRKQQNHNRYLAVADLPDEADDKDAPHRTYSSQRDLNTLRQALSGLKPKYRRTFLLSRVEDKTYREISEELGIPLSTVEKHMIKALQYLRDTFQDDAQ